MLAAHYPQVGSTNDAAARWARREPGRWLRVTAERQSGARGRSHRAWVSPRGGLWVSFAAPLRTPLAEREALPVVVGGAVRRVLHRLCETHGAVDRRVEIKWPNDVLIDGGKVAGVLCEQSVAEGQPAAAILGIGINANLRATELGDDLRSPAATLLDTLGQPVDLRSLRDDLTDEVRDAVEQWDAHGLTAETLAEINTHLAFRGRPVLHRLVLDPSPPADSVTLESVDERGRLVATDRAGGRRVYATGEIESLSPAPPLACPA